MAHAPAIARPQHVCAHPLQGAPIAPSLHYYYVHHEHSNKRLYHTPAITTTSIAYLYTRHGGSAELAPPMAKGIRPVREKEKRKSQ